MNWKIFIAGGLAVYVIASFVLVDTPEDKLVANFKAAHGDEPWFSFIDGIDVAGRATIAIHTRLDPLSPGVQQTGVEICEAMASTTPAEDEVFVNIFMLRPGQQQVDGSYDDSREYETSLAETVSFPEDSCEGELFESQIEDHRTALEQ